MSKNLVPIELPLINQTPASPLAGFAKVYLRNGYTKVLHATGTEKDLVLDRPLDNFNSTGPAVIVTATDTVFSGIEKLQKSLLKLKLAGFINGTATYSGGFLIIDTAIEPLTVQPTPYNVFYNPLTNEITYAQATTGPQGTTGAQGIQGLQGVQGTTGIQGVQGTQGIQGEIGPVGANGADALWNFLGEYDNGYDYNIGDVVTYAGGTWYRILPPNTGYPPGTEYWTPIALPGIQGTEGVQGVQGLEGLQGVQGTEGIQGYTGATGAQGTNGIQGETGATGSQGITGSDGAQGTMGLQGIMGFTGAQGSVGLQGTQGIQGVQGTQGIQGLNGLQGTQGIQGIQGNTGLQGIDGIQGVQGIQGIQGVQGIQGLYGQWYFSETEPTIYFEGMVWYNTSNGKRYLRYDGYWIQDGDNHVAVGPQGATGLQGVNGVQGPEGVQGTTGAQGVQGPSGTGGSGSGLQGSQIQLGNNGNQVAFGFTAALTAGNASTGTPTANRLDVYPLIPNKTLTNVSLTINVTTLGSGSLARLVVYSDLNGFPSTKLFESADIDCSTTGDKTVLSGLTFTAGTTYWLGFYSNGGATFRTITINSMMPIFSASLTTSVVAWSRINTNLGSAPSVFNYNTYSSSNQINILIKEV